MPSWDPNNLTAHHQKRITADAGCFEELLGCAAGQKVTEAEYAAASQAAIAGAWAEFEAEKHVAPNTYDPVRVTYADDRLVVSVTDWPRSQMITCFREHFNMSMTGHAVVTGMTVGQRRLRFKTQVDREEKRGMIRKVRRIHGV